MGKRARRDDCTSMGRLSGSDTSKVVCKEFLKALIKPSINLVSGQAARGKSQGFFIKTVMSQNYEQIDGCCPKSIRQEVGRI